MRRHNHIVEVQLGLEFLEQLVHTSKPWCYIPECIAGIPDDARLVDASFCTGGYRPYLSLYFTHPSFAAVPDDAEVPQFTPIFRTVQLATLCNTLNEPVTSVDGS